MTPLERAARALCKSHLEDPDEVVSTLGENPGTPIYAWQDRVHDARAVLTAIREPSEAMIASGNEQMDVDPELGHNEATPESIWRTMIDAMLEEGWSPG